MRVGKLLVMNNGFDDKKNSNAYKINYLTKKQKLYSTCINRLKKNIQRVEMKLKKY